jgi:hypothetical protein
MRPLKLAMRLTATPPRKGLTGFIEHWPYVCDNRHIVVSSMTHIRGMADDMRAN